MLRLSVLDQSTVVTGRSPDTSIRESLALAKHCEALGYHRYWCAEHHNSESQAGTAPEILISAIAATTSRIRVGTAGVMLPHYSSLKVAEQFRVLEAIAPGRIDLGLGRAPGSDGRTAYALNPQADDRGGPVPGAGARPAALAGGGTAGRGPPVPRHPRPAGRADGAGGVDPRQLRLRRAGGGVFRPAVLLRAFHHRRTRRGTGAGDLPGGLPAERTASRPACRDLRLGDGGGDAGRSGAAVHLARDVAAGARSRRVYRAALAGGGGGLYLYRRRPRAGRAAARAGAVWHAGRGGGKAARPGGRRSGSRRSPS